jgi:hypothetical protein
MNEELIFIGKRLSQLEVKITRKPAFHDIVCLTNHSSKNTPYQYIPIGIREQESIYFSKHNIRLTYGNNSLKIEGNWQLSDEEALNVYSNFAIRDGGKVSFLTHSLNKPEKRKKRQSNITSKKVKF